jgi:hypothetical protein
MTCENKGLISLNKNLGNIQSNNTIIAQLELGFQQVHSTYQVMEGFKVHAN